MSPYNPLASTVWALEPSLLFLNHGSFGATPRAVLAEQARLRDEAEANPMRFYARELEGRLDAARAALAELVGADPAGLAFVPNATTGVNCVLQSLRFAPGDELLVTSHGYNACNNAARFVAARDGAAVTVAPVPFPLASEDEVLEALERALTPRTRLALVDHVTSPTGLVLPVERIVRLLHARGVPVLVDGAHAPGMVPLDLRALGAEYYTANLHKWLCAPKGAALLYVREDLRDAVAPTVRSHAENSRRTDRPRFLERFDWTGTSDPTAYLCIPKCIEVLSRLSPDGLSGVLRDNRALALRARALLCEALEVAPPAPASMLGALAAVTLPPGRATTPSALYGDALQQVLAERYRIEVPIVPFPSPPARLVRVSAQRYNHEDEYVRLCEALRLELRREREASAAPSHSAPGVGSEAGAAPTRLTSAFWQDRYERGLTGWDLGGAPPVLRALLERLAREGAHRPGARVLVPGAGNGHDALAWAAAGYAVTAVDFAPSAVATTRANAERAGLAVDAVLGDVLALPDAMHGAFDVAWEQTCLCALDPSQREAYARALATALAPGATLYALLWAHGRPGGPPYHVPEETARALFAPYFVAVRSAPVREAAAGREGEYLLELRRS